MLVPSAGAPFYDGTRHVVISVSTCVKPVGEHTRDSGGGYTRVIRPPGDALSPGHPHGTHRTDRLPVGFYRLQRQLTRKDHQFDKARAIGC